ncbi:hypothetical protein TNCV_6371 [Trichonephila clavipes]|nr:hypothetical protein TNCV_6371 [Trichonephila clavipes]
MTPREEFMDLWGLTVKGDSKNVLANKNDLFCHEDVVSINKSPERNFLSDFGSPPIPLRAFCMANGDLRTISLLALTLQQCLFGDTEERYHQLIDRSGLHCRRVAGAGSLLPPVYSEEWVKENAEVSPDHHSSPYGRSVGQRERKGIPRTPFSSLRDAAHGQHAGWQTNGVS